jgi:hypothetical protein
VNETSFEVSHDRGGNLFASKPLITLDKTMFELQDLIHKMNENRVADYWIATVGGEPARQMVLPNTGVGPDDEDPLFYLSTPEPKTVTLRSIGFGGGDAATMNRVLAGIRIAEEHHHRLVAYISKAMGLDGDAEPALSRAQKFTKLFDT